MSNNKYSVKRKFGIIILVGILTLIASSFLALESIVFHISKEQWLPESQDTTHTSQEEDIGFKADVLRKTQPMLVRDFTVKLVTDPQDNNPEIWKESVIFDTNVSIKYGHIVYIDFKLGKNNIIKIIIDGDNRFNLMILDDDNFLKYRHGSNYELEFSRRNIIDGMLIWKVPREDTYYIVIDPETYADVYVKILLQPNPEKEDFTKYIHDRKAWYIWIIHAWISQNINYVNDPYSEELVQYPNKTLDIRAGDCDDVAVLLSSMYRSVGLETKYLIVDTDGDGMEDHLSVAVFYPGTVDEFIDSIINIMKLAGFTYYIPSNVSVKYENGTDGVWIISDPLFNKNPYFVGMLANTPYIIVEEFK